MPMQQPDGYTPNNMMNHMGGVGGYADMQGMGYVPPPAPSQAHEAGRYVFQPDGTQIYVPYSHDQ